MQIDSHMHFKKGWDTSTIAMVEEKNKLNSGRAVITYMPYPSSNESKGDEEDKAGQRIPIVCNGFFSNGPWDGQLIHLNTTMFREDGVNGGSIDESPFLVSGNVFTTSGKYIQMQYDRSWYVSLMFQLKKTHYWMTFLFLSLLLSLYKRRTPRSTI